MSKLRHLDQAVMFRCPGCGQDHMLYIEQTTDCGPHPVWSYNGNAAAPTFMPSVLVTRSLWVPPVTPHNLPAWQAKPWKQEQVRDICHSFITDGKIQFLSDCTHALANQTVDLPDWKAE